MAAETIQDRIAKQKEEAEKRRKAQEEAAGGTPATPLGVSGLGATPDQAKMAGTPAALGAAPQATPADDDTMAQAATQQAAQTDVAQDDTLQTELGEKSFEDQQRDASQERAKAFSESMQAFGSLGDRVEALVEQEFSGSEAGGDLKLLTEDFEFEIKPEEVAKMVGPGSNSEEVTAVLADFNKKRNDPNAAYHSLVDNQSKFANPNSDMMDIVKRAYKNEPEVLRGVVARLIADDVVDPDQVNIEHLLGTGFLTQDGDNIVELGITTGELDELLGDQWATMTPSQIGEEVQRVQEDVLANQEKIEEQLADPNLPPQTRAALIDELKRMGATGAVAYEQQAEEAAIEAADAGKIMFGGKVEDIENLLDDENIQQQTINYLSNPESPEGQEWARNNPEFAEWMEREFAELEGNKEVLERNIGNFKGIQKHNEDFMTRDMSGQIINKDLMNQMGYGNQGFEMNNYSAEDNPTYKMLTNLPGDQQGDAIATINDMATNNPGYLDGFSDLDPAGLGDILSNPEKRSEFKNVADIKKDWADALASGSRDNMVNLFLKGNPGTLKNSDELRARLSELYTQSKFPGADNTQYNKLAALFDTDNDGLIDDTHTVAAQLDKMIREQGSAKSLIDSGGSNPLTSMRDIAPAPKLDNSLFDKIRGAISMTDTTITPEEMAAAGLTWSEIEELKNMKSPDGTSSFGIDDAAASTVQNQAAEARIDEITSAKGTGGFSLDELDVANAVATGDIATADRVKELTTELEDVLKNGSPAEKSAAGNAYRKLQQKMVAPSPSGSYGHRDFNYAIDNFSHILTFPFVPPGKGHLFSKNPEGKYVLTTGGSDYAGAREIYERYRTYTTSQGGQNNPEGFMRALTGLLPGETPKDTPGAGTGRTKLQTRDDAYYKEQERRNR